MNKFVIPIAAAGMVLAWEGCASVSVKPKACRDVPPDSPRRIVVQDFRFAGEPDRIRVDREGPQLHAFKAKLVGMMRADLTSSLGRFGIPVEQAPGCKVPPGPRGWLVTGEFTRVNQGSRALRVLVGAGAGGTKMETRVRVLDTKTSRLICAFRTTGGSNAGSGIITSYGPLTVATLGGAVLNVVGSIGHGVTEDTKRTAKMIGNYISQQLARRGAIPPDKAREPKILDGPVNPLGSLKN